MIPDLEHWEQLQSLFHLAEATPEADRERVLSEVCPDPALRRRVFELLGAVTPDDADRRPLDPGQAVGPYRIVRHLGTGGMGAVYLAERTLEGITQRLALKVVAPHAAGPAFVDRFQRERRILASLEHPNITRMSDAGVTPDGRPYLVMEYVDGVHLDVYCESRKLTLAARIRLFRTICEAVDYAHRQLVVHLDLKPSNILVTDTGVPKLLDFGTSRLLENAGTLPTVVLATPAYCSPEQLRHQTLGTGSDMYSLGVILSELVAEPRPEDLATIIRKCLAPFPQDRYTSAAALSDDLGRFLEGRPVLARRQTRVYQISRFVQRNSGKVSLTLIMAAALVLAAAYAWVGQQRALREAQRAARMQTFLSLLFKSANSNVVGKPASTVKEFLETAENVLPIYLKDPADLRQAQVSLADSLYWNQNLPAARRLSEQALAGARASGDPPVQADALRILGMIDQSSGKPEAARAHIEEALEISSRQAVPFRTRFLIVQDYVLIEEDSGKSTEKNLTLLKTAIDQARKRNLNPQEIAEALNYYSGLMRIRGRLDEAGDATAEALRLNDSPLTACDYALSEYALASIRRSQNRHAEAANQFRDVYRRMITCSGAEAPYTLNAQAYLAETLIAVGRVNEALPMLEKSEPLWLRPPVNSNVVFTNFWILGHAYIESSRYADAERVLSESLKKYGQALPANDKRVAWTRYLLARALVGEGRASEALPLAQLASRNLSAGATTPLAKSNAQAAQVLLSRLQSH